jgi:DNA-binding CsgD family transcriptional regulator
MSLAEEMMSYYGVAEDPSKLEHYGIPRRSGRYPWGSGDDGYQHNIDFLGRIELLKKKGWEETAENIKKEFGMSVNDYRREKSWANYDRRKLEVARAKSLRDDGLGPTEIGKRMGINESTVRSLLSEQSEKRMELAMETVKILKESIDNNPGGMIDVGPGNEIELGISRTKLDDALYYLKTREGYHIYKGGIKQPTNPGQQTNQTVLARPDKQHKDIYKMDEVGTIMDYTSHDDGKTFTKFQYPASMDSSRLMVRYKETGGLDRDGLIEIRRGVKDLSLGKDTYSQVRILVDDTHYIKGMAILTDGEGMPPGVDVIFNSNKPQAKGKIGALKEIKNDPDNPFGSLIKANGQSYYIDDDGNKKLSLINKRAEQGDWSEWKDALPSQFLGKQSLEMAKKQLGLAKADKVAEYDEICALTNPTIKKHLLEKFASTCDGAAVHLQAAALPGQKYHVIIPVPELKDTEVYAPNYADGTKLALIRYPHGGTFEIPILTVNNKNAPAKKLIGADAQDAVGINAHVAERLSGADFDGDTVMCIPTHDKAGKVKITSTPKLKGLEGFDSKSYQYDDISPDGKHYYRNGQEIKIMRNTGTQMGIVSNLITDMTLQGATQEELARAVRHSMVVIDAEKHKLDYKQSELDNNILELKKKYQTGGASTLLSRSKGETPVLKRQGSPNINTPGKPWYDPTKPEGSLIWKTAEDLEYTVPKVNKRTGEVTMVTKQRTQKSTKMAEALDARDLISEANTPMERLYADYANSMKSLANQARKEMMATGNLKTDPSAKATYKAEYDSLMAKLNTAQVNAVRERAALRKANAVINEKIASNPDMKKSDLKKERQRATTAARAEVGSISRKDRNIKITDREWEAIQAGAITEHKLKQILDNADIDELRSRATPRNNNTLSEAKVNRIKAMSNSNYTNEQIANALGISPSSVAKCLKGE